MRTIQRRKCYGILAPKSHETLNKEGKKISREYHLFSFPAAWFVIYKCQGLEGSSGYKLWDVYRNELHPKHLEDAIHVESEYEYMDIIEVLTDTQMYFPSKWKEEKQRK